jgi:hypothetical protein
VDPSEAYYARVKGAMVFATQDSYETGTEHGHIVPVWRGTGDYKQETTLSNKEGWGGVRHPYVSNQALNGTENTQQVKLPANWAFVTSPRYYVVPDNITKLSR